MATARFLAAQKPNGTAYVIGEGGLLNALHENGYAIVDHAPDYVIIGEGRTLTFEMIEAAGNMVREGAKLIATNLDPNCPTPNGIRPGCGAIVAMIEAVTGVKAFSVGKPSPIMMRAARKALGLTAGPNPNEYLATYEFTPPGGSWDWTDYGDYEISVNADEILTTDKIAAPAWLVNSLSVAIPGQLTVTTKADSGPGSLRDAVDAANASVGTADTITFDPAAFASATTIRLEPGTHTLQLDLGDAAHRQFDPPIVSKRITIHVK